MNDFIDQLKILSEKNPILIVATLCHIKGSAPQNLGAKMILGPDGILYGTIGGGKLEKKVIELSKDLIHDSTFSFNSYEWNLQRDIGMTCGGQVIVSFEAIHSSHWNVVIFGAGHVAQSLIRTLLPLKLNIQCVDIRQEWLSKLPQDHKLKTIQVSKYENYVEHLKPEDFVLLMTMGQSYDSPVLQQIFIQNKKLNFLGVIGSEAKKNAMIKDLKQNNLEQFQDQFTCPLGFPLGDNSPEEIAISIAAQLLQKKDLIFKNNKWGKYV
jgi:xanthine dehydrogenase accessory factor